MNDGFEAFSWTAALGRHRPVDKDGSRPGAAGQNFVQRQLLIDSPYSRIAMNVAICMKCAFAPSR